MAKRSFAVMGATGRIGRALSDELLRRGHEVRALGRNPIQLEALRLKGAKAHPAAFDDPVALAEAFRGASAVFAFLPPGYQVEDLGLYQDRVGEAIATALRLGRATRVVNLSSLGADLHDGTGPIKGLHRQEERLEALAGLDVVHLRPAYFLENLLGAIPAIRASGTHPSPLRPDLAIAMVATRDVAAAAADLLVRFEVRGRAVVELEGPRRLTMVEATEALGRAIGRPELEYVQISYADAEKAMLGLGMTKDAAWLMSEMARAMNAGRIEPREAAGPVRKGTTAIEDFAREFAAVWRAG